MKQIEKIDHTIQTLEAIISTLLKNRTNSITIDEINETRIALIKTSRILKEPFYEALRV